MAPLTLKCKTSVTIVLFSFLIFAAKYTEEERIAIAKFRPIVLDVLTQGYQKTDSYLIQWLGAKELDLDAAAEMLENVQKWRKEQKVDTILEEPNIFDESGYNGIIESLDGFDKQGAPWKSHNGVRVKAIKSKFDLNITVVTYNFGKVDVRRLILEGREKYFRRSLIFLWEKMALMAREASNRTGSEESQVVIISDLTGFTRKQHLCVPCVPFLLASTQIVENYYPRLFKLHVLVNVPRGYDFTLHRIDEVFNLVERKNPKRLKHSNEVVK